MHAGVLVSSRREAEGLKACEIGGTPTTISTAVQTQGRALLKSGGQRRLKLLSLSDLLNPLQKPYLSKSQELCANVLSSANAPYVSSSYKKREREIKRKRRKGEGVLLAR